MKATLTFDLDDPIDRERHYAAVHGQEAFLALWDIGQLIFRPARKHGYIDSKIQSILEECGSIKDPRKGEELIRLLEEEFYKLLEQRGLDLERAFS